MALEEKQSEHEYPCFIRVAEDEHDSFIELPSEKNGSILLSTIQAQFPNAIGLKYRSSTGGWRGVRLSENCLDPPYDGWGTTTFFITLPKTDSVKRKMEESPNREPEAKLVKTGPDDAILQSDLIVLGLPYKATEEDLKEYFQKFGELTMHEVKLDPRTKESRGFGFIRFKSTSAAEKALKASHSILGRRCELRLPKRKEEMPMKLFIGRLPDGTTKSDLLNYFEDYGEISDCYIPSPFRGFGFITFVSSETGRHVLNRAHIYKGGRLNVTYAEPKADQRQPQHAWNDRKMAQYSAGQDPPFNFDAMRQIVSRSTYGHLYSGPSRSSSDSNRQSHVHSRNTSSTNRNSTYDSSSSKTPSHIMGSNSKDLTYTSAYNSSNTANIAAAFGNATQFLNSSSTDQRNIPYGFWGNSE